jgi:phosphoesterase RecJ-like protein
MFKELIDLIEQHDVIIIHRHSNPDGDAIGSQVGLYEILRKAYPEKKIYKVGDDAGRYAFIKGSNMDNIDDSLYKNALAIVLDTSAKALVSDTRYEMAKATVRMDHHMFCENVCQTEITDTACESCCGLIVDFAIAGGYALTDVGAEALYTGMVTDSGRFRYDSTDKDTHRRASHLMQYKIDTNEIYRNLYSQDLADIQLRARFTLKINFTKAGTAYIYTTKQEAADTGASIFTISRGMVGTMSEIRGVTRWVNFTETDDGVLAEIRSNKYNINSIAKKYGGGGHIKASGATLKNKDEAMEMLKDLDMLCESDLA